ncbi:hypothetical protein [Pseudoalteromonas sp. McH1-42]|uniref:hypothetical protein n=1 Tax=Pseudoalteromonas sp. McH1-42 TaxID=2917752 RepID=UPI001EF5DCB4|nr:hypothetical protein [Pseudoalteromonas sp. McH1-42]MCG7564202.1 hypothetical protein [Pseudoalteromonas sp. McH1-42]
MKLIQASSLAFVLTGCTSFYASQVKYIEEAPANCEFVTTINDVANLGYEDKSIQRMKALAYKAGADTLYYQFPDLQEIELSHGASESQSLIDMQAKAYICGKL